MAEPTLQHPQVLSAKHITDRSIELSWPAFSGHSKFEALESWSTVYSDNMLSAEIVGLEPHTAYKFRLRAVHGDGPTNWSPILTVSTLRLPITGEDLHKAVAGLDLIALKEILASGQVSVDVPDSLGLSSLMSACQRGETAIAETLLAHGADVNCSNCSGKTSLMLAAYGGHSGLVDLLLRHQAKVDARDRSGSTALHWAVDGGDCLVLKLLLRAGCQPNERDHVSHWTPLMRAAAIGGNSEVTAFILSQGADHTLLDKEGKSSLMIAAVNGHKAMVQVLLQHGADPSIRSVHGKTALDFARTFGYEDIVTSLAQPQKKL